MDLLAEDRCDLFVGGDEVGFHEVLPDLTSPVLVLDIQRLCHDPVDDPRVTDQSKQRAVQLLDLRPEVIEFSAVPQKLDFFADRLPPFEPLQDPVEQEGDAE
ncbi:hypothetical protein BON30_15325 [Cystobacter ferrugineus]|uniref:Uncharacterized protein n=1 Tax=Cystobacter ferrugineus TaxID=83449 RepID=A0A1L9BDQ5_9BACT|nr:hypothetical protein BON30_15325 [Cystobacter ferrugineus]